jgi:nucleoside 2-deoxyribosyltransferase
LRARTVVICGSMKSLDLMSRIGEFLRAAGLHVVVPAPDETTEISNRTKRLASWRHMDSIKRRRTAAVLVVNVDRPNVPHYIGPNSFAEIGVAFAVRRPVFLLQGMPESYAEELTAWGVTCLNQDVRPLLDAVPTRRIVDWSAWQDTLQGARADSITPAMVADS